MEYYPVIKRDEVVKHSKARMNLENMLRTRRQIQNTTKRMFPFLSNIQKRQINIEKID